MGATPRAPGFASLAPSAAHLPRPAPAEFAAYGDEPPQMKSGAVGKSGYLRLGFEHRDGRTILADLDSRTPFLAQRALHCDDALPDMAWLFMITTGGCVLQGDRLALDVALGEGARAHVTTQSATKVHSMDANYAHQTQSFTLGEGAYLEFLPDPLIPHRQARFANDTRIVIDPTASMLCSEIVQPGRKHHHPDECFGATLLSLSTSAARPGGQLLFSEKLVIEPLRNPDAAIGRDGRLRRVRQRDSVHAGGRRRPRPCARGRRGRPGRRAWRSAPAGCPTTPASSTRCWAARPSRCGPSVREFWEVARHEITGAAIPPPFFWR